MGVPMKHLHHSILVSVVAGAIAAAGIAAQGSLPRLTIDPPQGFLRSPISGADVESYDSFAVNATLRIYPFRPVTGDAVQTFQRTLFLERTPLDVVAGGRISQPVFDRATMAGADAVLSARYGDTNGRSHLRLAVVIGGGTAVAIIHLRTETPSGMEQVLPSFRKVLGTMRIDGGPLRLAKGTGADTRAVAGLYTVPRLKLSPVAGASTMSTYFYLFSADGRVYRGYGLPKAPQGDITRFDYAAAAQEDPENAGTFEIRGNQLVLRMGWQYPYSITTAVPDAAGNVTIENSTLKRQLK